MNEQDWIEERFDASGSSIGFRVRRKLHEEQSDFQLIEIWESTDFGHLMALDGCWMLTGRENFIYHEMLAQPAINSITVPSRVAIIGGGDCGTLREVLKYPQVKQATQIEIDERVTRVSEQFFPELCVANDDPRAELLFEDGLAWIDTCEPGSQDLILVDSTDPVDMAEGLVSTDFFRACHQAIASGGVLGMQSESPLLHQSLLSDLRDRLKEAGFDSVRHFLFPQPCYPSGWWCVTLAGRQNSFSEYPCHELGDELENRYYNAAIHKASQQLPEFMRQQILG